MKDSSFRKSFGVVILLFWMGVLWNGCGPRISGYRDGIIDTTEHRLYNGFMFIKMEKPDDAQREFERALFLNARSSAAHRGMGIVYAMKGNSKSAFASMDLAMSVAETDEERALASTGMMSLYTMGKDRGWLEMVEKSFKQALALSTQLPEPYFELGIAYKESFQLQRSKVAFDQVIEINKTLVGEAQEQLLILNKMDKAMAKTELGRRILLVDRVTRAQTAALLIAETEIDDLLELVPARSPESAVPPLGKEGVSLTSDVSGNVFEGFIQKALQLRIQGLSTFSDGTFGPDEYMTRAGFAVIIADIISRFREVLLFLPTGPRFKDVRPDSPYYKAIMISTEGAKIMDAKGDLFETMGTLSGVDALLCFRKVEKRLKTP
jgi:tetratricopeptide (TPR) repeat protein